MYQIEQSRIEAQQSGRAAVPTVATVRDKRQARDTDIYTLCRVNDDDTEWEGNDPEGGAGGEDDNDDGGDRCGCCVPATSASVHLANGPKRKRAAQTPWPRDCLSNDLLASVRAGSGQSHPIINRLWRVFKSL